MPPKTEKLLEDIHDAATFIARSMDNRSFAEYTNDRLLRQAVERNFEIIGEAMNRLARVDAQTASLIKNYQQIIAFRNILIHGYDLIDHAAVWRVIETDLPLLLQQTETLLRGSEE